MFSGATHAVRRFSLLLLEEGELYVEDFVATARWPAAVAGNWQRLPRLPGSLRLCTKSLFFEPDDPRVPIVRLPFQYVEGLEGSGDRRLVLTASRLVKMRANAVDAPYAVERAVAAHHHPPAAAGQGQRQHAAPTSPGRPSSGGGGGGVVQRSGGSWGGGGGGAEAAQQAQQGQQGQQQGQPLFHWEFELSYAKLEGVMPLAQQMMVASRLPPGEREEFLAAAMASAEEGLRFDVGFLRNPGEQLVAELACTLLSQGALVREPGRLLVTDQRLYFQPLHNISGDAPVSSHPLAAVAAAARRRSSLRDVALEVFFSEPLEEQSHLAPPPLWGGPSALFTFASREERERAVEAISGQAVLGAALPGGREAAAACAAILEADPSWLSRVTSAWQRGRMSNLDYLLFLNLASGRSFSDLSQYPVFPWVLADYSSDALDLSDPAAFRDLSRPVGALNARRLDMLRERYREMAGFSPEPPFLYGSHYSTPGFTMFWLVRAAPAHLLRLQNGRFDAPDRLFCSVGDAWEGVTGTNPSDVKELIPEFYLRHDFLVNSRNLALGTRQSGRPVGDVELPPWAASAPHFAAVLRAALEAPVVSANLHHWIDLIFGYKQRGEAAEEADNVFRHTAYEGAVDIDAVEDRTERIALETQINEFGQCPRQLFRAKHPQRLVCPPASMPSPSEAAAEGAAADASDGDGGGSSHALPLALVSSILAAAAEGHGESPRLEVPPLLAELDILAARQTAEAAAAAQAAAEAAAAAAEGAPAGQPPGNGSPPQGQQEDREQAMASGGSSGRLRSLGAWAAERKQAVGERLAGSVGAVREALAGPQPSGGSAARLQSLFNRKGSSSSVASSAAATEAAQPAPAAATAAGAAAGGSVPESPAACAAAGPGPGTSPTSPAVRMAASLVGSLGGRLSSFTGRGSGGQQEGGDGGAGGPPSGSPGAAAAAAAGAEPVGTSQQDVAQAQQPEQAAAAAAGKDSSPSAVGAGPMWKFARQGGRQAGAGKPAALAAGEGSSDEDEQLSAAAARTPVRGGAEQPAGSSPRQQQQYPGSGPASPAPSGAGSAPTSPSGVGRASPRRGWFGPGLRDRLQLARVVPAGGESINGCALAAPAGGASLHVYSASHSGTVRVHSVDSGEQVRAASLSEQPLTSVVLLPPAGGGGGGADSSGGRRHPLVLCGSFDACVHAYSPDSGRQAGSFQVAGDAVACLQMLGGWGGGLAGGSSARLLAGSWDGSIKVWELAEGRQPWSSSFPQPLSLMAAPSSVWAVAADGSGRLVLAGTEDGVVAAWDLRVPGAHPLWQHQLVADNYIGGVDFCPSSPGQAGVTAAVVAAADGSLTLLDLRRLATAGRSSAGSAAGMVAASVCPSGMPLRCVVNDGRLALAGDEGGSLHAWDVAGQLGEPSPPAPGAWTPPQPDGLYAPLPAAPPSAVTALAAAPAGGWGPAAGGGGGGAGVVVVSGHDNGLLRFYAS